MNRRFLSLLFSLFTLALFAQNKTTTQHETISLSAVQSGGALGIDLKGLNVSIGQWEAPLSGGHALIDTSNSDLSQAVNMDTGTASSHATTVAEIMVSSGSATPSNKGIAPLSSLFVYDLDYPYDGFYTELGQAIESQRLLLSNHSYSDNEGWSGSGVWQGVVQISETEDYKFGYYGERSRKYDSLMYEHPHHLIVRSVQNDRAYDGSTASFQVWSYSGGVWSQESRSTPVPEQDGGVDGYDGLSSDATSKNALVVGAVDNISGGFTSTSDITFANSASAWGPTDDGRVKPDLVAPGQLVAGSSFASYSTPVVTGLGALIQGYYIEKYGRQLRSSSLKGVLIHTADAMTSDGSPNAQAGWGLVNAESAAAFVQNADGNQRLVESELRNGESIEYRIYLDGTNNFRGTLVWTDPKGSSPVLTYTASDLDNATPILVNDLDIELLNSDGSVSVALPWKLDVANPGNAATRGDNDVDNVLRIDYPAGSISAGWYIVRITHEGTLSNSQPYSLLLSDAGGVNFNSGTWSLSPASWGQGVFLAVQDTSTVAQVSISRTVGGVDLAPGAKLKIAEGNTLTVLGEVFLRADADGLASVKGEIDAIVCSQSYISGSADWRYLASPCRTTVGEWGADLTTLNLSSHSSPSLYGWDAVSAQWKSLSASDSAHANGGLVVYAGGNAHATFSRLPLVKSAIGKPVSRHQALTLVKDDNNDPNDGNLGWNLISNPYFAALDWTALDVSQTGGSYYIWNSHQSAFASSNGSIHVNGGKRYISPSQSFWLYCPSSLSGSLTLDTAAVTFSGNRQVTKRSPSALRVRFYLDGGFSDEVVVQWQDQGDTSFVWGEDIPKRESGYPNRPEPSWIQSRKTLALAATSSNIGTSIPLFWQESTAVDSVVILEEDLDRSCRWEWNGAVMGLHDVPLSVWSGGGQMNLVWDRVNIGLSEISLAELDVRGRWMQWNGEKPLDTLIYDVNGQLVSELSFQPGECIEWTGRGGVYVIHSERDTQRIFFSR